MSTVDAVAQAVRALGAGRTVCLSPGTYRLADRLTFGPGQSGTANAPATIRAAEGLGSVTIDAAGHEEALYFAGAQHVAVEGLRITNGAWHAIKIDHPSSDLLIRGNSLFDNVKAGDDAQYSAIKGCCLAARITVEGNEIYYTKRGPGSNHQGIDCNGCDSWVVRGNRIHGIRSAGEGGNAVQFKSGSTDTVIENNVIYDNFLGVSFGGFGTPSWGGQQHEHVRGIVRNNVIYGNDDAGISVLDSVDGKVYNNTLFDNGFTPDVRRAAVNLAYRNNILDRPLNLRDGTSAATGSNYVLAAPGDGGIFVDAAGGDFRPKASAGQVVGRGQNLGADVPTDAAGRRRPSGAYDIGAFQH